MKHRAPAGGVLLLAAISGLAAAAAELPQCTRVLPGPTFPRVLLPATTPDAGLSMDREGFPLPADFLSYPPFFVVSAVHEMDLTGTGETIRIEVEGWEWWFPVTVHLPQYLRRFDPETGETLWRQELPRGLLGPGRVLDVDGDGRDDLVFDRFEVFWFWAFPGGLATFWGNGDGPLVEGFRAHSSPRLESVEDADGDGLRDLVVVLESNRTLYRGTGPRSFDEGIAYTRIVENVLVDEPGRWLLIGDVNEDGLDDVLAITHYEDTLSLGISRGDGTFDLRGIPSPGSRSVLGTLEDWDGDGHLDLVFLVFMGGPTPSEFRVAWGRGDGTFEPYASLPVGERFYGFAFGDFTGDGRRDVVVEYTSPPDTPRHTRLAALPIRGRTIGDPVVFEHPWAPFFFRTLVLADLDGDGLADLVSGAGTYPGPYRVVWRAATGDGGFGPVRDLLDRTFVGPVERIVPTDFDLDGVTDLFVQVEDLLPGRESNFSLRGNGTGAFEVVFSSGPITRYYHDRFEDVDADGRPDLVSRVESIWYDGHLTYPVAVRPGDGLGGFGPPIETRWLGFSGPTGRFRTVGTRDMARIGWFGDATADPRTFGLGLFQIEVFKSDGHVLPRDLAPPVVEIRVLPVPGAADPHLRRVATLPIDECSSAPRVTERFVDLLPLGEGIPFSYRRGDAEEVLVYEVPGTGRRGVVLVGPDRSAIRDAFFAAKARGGFPFRHMAPMRIVSTGAYGDPLPGFPAARLVQRIVLEGGFVTGVEVTRPGSEVTFRAKADDGVHR